MTLHFGLGNVCKRGLSNLTLKDLSTMDPPNGFGSDSSNFDSPTMETDECSGLIGNYI